MTRTASHGQSHTSADTWSKTVSVGMHTAYVFERKDRNGALYVKFSSPTKHGRDRRICMKVPFSLGVRDAKGCIDKRLAGDVVTAVARMVQPLLDGVQPSATAPKETALSLSAGFDRALCFTRGKFPTKSARWEEVERGQRKLERILGRDTKWVDIRFSDARNIWRTLAQEYVRGGKKRGLCGMRQAEVTVDALYSVASWLREEELLPPTACVPAASWRAKLMDEWKRLTNEDTSPARPRHSADEMRKLYQHLSSPDVDPRFSLAFNLGGEQRLGQVLRANRSQLDLPKVDCVAAKVGELGWLEVSGMGKKRAKPIMFTRDLREVVDDALVGYLAEYEALYATGQIADYKLFPAGRLVGGNAKVVANPEALGRTGARKMFIALEKAAGVESISGRGWYGVRRVAADLAENFETDERVLNALTGHDHSSTRRIYQDGGSRKVLCDAAVVRARLRIA